MEKSVILITGPGGSGKTSLAEFIEEKDRNSNFVAVAEDAFWVEFKKNCPEKIMRTPQEELIVQGQVISHVEKLLRDNKNIALEFILYSDPPSPLLAYKKAFEDIGATVIVAVLKPSAETILERKKIRARDIEQDIDVETANTLHQLKCLESPCIDNNWIIENDNISIAATYDKIKERS